MSLSLIKKSLKIVDSPYKIKLYFFILLTVDRYVQEIDR